MKKKNTKSNTQTNKLASASPHIYKIRGRVAFIKHTDTATHTCRGQKVKSKQGTNRRNENEPKHNERDHKRRCINNKKKARKTGFNISFYLRSIF